MRQKTLDKLGGYVGMSGLLGVLTISLQTELFQIPGDPKNRFSSCTKRCRDYVEKIVCDHIIRHHTVADKHKDAELRQSRECQNYIYLRYEYLSCSPQKDFLKLLFLLIITIVCNTHREYDTVLSNNETSCVQLLLVNCPGIFLCLDMDIPVVNDIISSVYQLTHAYDHLIAS